MKGVVAIPSIDIGATNIRIAYVLRRSSDGTLHDSREEVIVWEGSPAKMEDLRADGNFIEDLSAYISSVVREGEEILSNRGMRVVRHIGISAPGAYLETNRIYPGTVPNVSEFEDTSLTDLVEGKLGEDWKVSINNDGVVQALVSVQMLMNSPVKERITESAMRKGKVVGIVPGTGFGAGGFFIDEAGSVTPMPGPQQFFDIEVEDGESRVILNGRCGNWFAVKAKELGLSAGDLTGVLETKDSPEREEVKELYRQAAGVYARGLKAVYEGRGVKTVVTDPVDVLDQFWENVEGTEIFILGGFITAHPIIKRIMFGVIEETLREAGLGHIVLVAQDELQGLDGLGSKVGVLGSSFLVPEQELVPERETRFEVG